MNEGRVSIKKLSLFSFFIKTLYIRIYFCIPSKISGISFTNFKSKSNIKTGLPKKIKKVVLFCVRYEKNKLKSYQNDLTFLMKSNHCDAFNLSVPQNKNSEVIVL